MQGGRNRRTDAPGRPGDQRSLAGEIEHCFSPVRPGSCENQIENDSGTGATSILMSAKRRRKGRDIVGRADTNGLDAGCDTLD